jgi:hypothetical protein
LTQNTALLNENENLADFYKQHYESDFAEADRLAAMVQNRYRFDENLQSSIEILLDSIDLESEAILKLEGSPLGDNPKIVLKTTQISEQLAQIQELEEHGEFARKEYLVAALARNEAWKAKEIWKKNEQTVNRILLSSMLLQSDTLTEKDLGALRFVAAQCSEEGGMIVWTARALLPFCEQPNYMKNGMELPCEAFVPSAASAKTSQSNDEINLYPNPANETLTISIPNINNTTITLFNSIGKSVYQSISLDSSHQIALNHFETGIYFCQIKQDNKVIIKKVLIQKP